MTEMALESYIALAQAPRAGLVTAFDSRNGM